MSGDPLDGMRERIVRCRRLAKEILDRKATQALLEMAEEIERDLKALEAEREARRTNAEPIGKDVKPTIIIRPE